MRRAAFSRTGVMGQYRQAMAHVLIVGGGFGGLAAAHELRGLLGDGHQVTLVDRTDHFYMGFAKLWDLAGIRPLAEGTASRAALEGHGVRFLRAEITRIEPEGRRVHTSDGTVTADALLVALGAAPADAHRQLLRAPGAHDLYDADQLAAMRQALDDIEDGRVVVSILGAPVKCPPAPYEAALLVDERLRQRGLRDAVELAVTIPQPMTLPAAGVDASRYVADRLVERGIELMPSRVVTEVDGDRRVVRFEDAPELEYGLLLGVPATAPPAVTRDSPLASPAGWIEPDRHSLRTAFERVYAVGDCTLTRTAKGQLPKAGVFAAAQGQVAARNAAADLVGGEGAGFDGHGFCFLEVPGRRVAVVEGDFFAEPEPDVVITEPDEEQFRRKQLFESERLARWLG